MFSRQIELLNKIVAACELTERPFLNQNLENPTRYFTLGMLGRMKDRCCSLIPLLEAFPQNNAVEFGIGLILRNQSIDSLAALYEFELLRFKKTNELESFLLNYLNDGYKTTVPYLKSLQDHFLNKFEADIIEKHIQILSEGRKTRKRETVKGLYDKLLTHQSGSEEEDAYRKALARQAYDTYIYFSKIEHFSMESSLYERMVLRNRLQTIQMKVYYTVFYTDVLHKTLALENDTEFSSSRSAIVTEFLQETMRDFEK